MARFQDLDHVAPQSLDACLCQVLGRLFQGLVCLNIFFFFIGYFQSHSPTGRGVPRWSTHWS